MKKVILLSLVVCLLTSCSFIARVGFGIKKPSLKETSYVLDYAQKLNMDTSEVFFAGSQQNWAKLLNKREMPSVEIYDRKGRFVRYKPDSLKCNAPAFNLTNDICNSAFLSVDSSRNIKDITSRLYNYNSSYLTQNDYDYVVVVYWATFAGKLNKDHTKVWVDNINAQKKSNCNLKVINLSLDIINANVTDTGTTSGSAFSH